MLSLSENTLLKILKYGVYASLLWFFIIVRSSMFPAHGPRVLFLQVIIEILAVFYVWLILQYPNYHPKLKLRNGKFNWLLIAVLAWFFVLVFSAVFGVDFWASISSQLERMTGVFFIAHIVVFFLILGVVFRSWIDWRNFLTANVAIGVINFLPALYQKMDPTFLAWAYGEKIYVVGRIAGFFSNPSMLASYALFILFLALFLFLKSETWKGKIFNTVAFLTAFLAIFFAGTRGTLAGALFGLIIFIFLYAAFSKNKKTKIISFSFLGILLVSGIFLYANKNQPWVDSRPAFKRFVDIKLEDLSTRHIFLKSAWQGFKERPILGWGHENFNLVFNKYYNPDILEYGTGESWSSKAHNIFFEYLATSGILGLLSYLALFLSVKYLLFRKYKEDNNYSIEFAVFVSLFVGHLAQNAVLFDTTFTYYMTFIALGYINFLGSGNDAKETEKCKNTLAKQDDFRGGMVVVILVLAVFLAYMNFSTFKSLKQVRNFDEKFLETTSFYGDDLRAAYLRFYLNGMMKFDEDQNALKKLDFEFDKIVKDHPLNLNFIILKIQLMLYLSKYDDSYLEKADNLIAEKLAQYPDNQYLYLLKGNMEMGRKNFSEAMENYKKAVELNPESLMPRWFLGFVLYQKGDREEAMKEFDYAYERGYFPENAKQVALWGGIYGENKRFYEAIFLYKKSLESDPQNAEYYKQLAIIYKEIKDNNKAIEMAKKVIELNPKMKEEAESFINSLK